MLAYSSMTETIHGRESRRRCTNPRPNRGLRDPESGHGILWLIAVVCCSMLVLRTFPYACARTANQPLVRYV